MSTSRGGLAGLNPSSVRSDEWCPEIVSWNTTERCNLRCGHCYLAAGPPGTGELSHPEGRQLIEQLADAGTKMLILTGGEPMTRPDIAELAAHATSKGMLVVLGTNGVLLTTSRVRQLKAAGVSGVGISLDSLRPEKHDAFRGVPGACRGAIRGIRICAAEELPVLIQMTVLPWNYREVADLMEFAHVEGAAGFTLYFLVCTGRGEEVSDITPLQYEEALASLVEAQGRYPNMMVRARCAPQIIRMASQQDSPLVASAGCLAARRYCRVTPEGDVTPCPYLPLVGGSVRERSFGDIWQNAPVFQRLRNRPPEGRCGRCDFRELCGGCRARAFAAVGDLFGEDPWCAYQPVEYEPAGIASQPSWNPESEERLQRMPSFIRNRVREAVERYAQTNGESEITPAVVTATLGGLGRRIPFRRPPNVGQTTEPAPGDSSHEQVG
jgi:radical SAM protein with 4Fe4S-binding SPASM domain